MPSPTKKSCSLTHNINAGASGEASTATMILLMCAGFLEPTPWLSIVCRGTEVEKDVATNIDSPKEGVERN